MCVKAATPSGKNLKLPNNHDVANLHADYIPTFQLYSTCTDMIYIHRNNWLCANPVSTLIFSQINKFTTLTKTSALFPDASLYAEKYTEL